MTERPDQAEELGVTAPNIVFHGPPGTGKTYLAKALATELGYPVAVVSGADVQSKWINESAEQVNALFTEAQQVASSEGGAVIFLDELDTVLKDRTANRGHDEDNKVVNEFLNHLQETTDHNIIFIGATNRADALDEAGTRSGRIDKKVKIGKPDTETRAAIFAAQLSDRPVDLSAADLKTFAEQTEGLVAADIETIVETAAKEVLMTDDNEIKPKHVEKAVEEFTSK